MDSDLLGHGWKGDVLEFFMTYGALNEDDVPNLINMLKVFDVSTMAYYNFHSDSN